MHESRAIRGRQHRVVGLRQDLKMRICPSSYSVTGIAGIRSNSDSSIMTNRAINRIRDISSVANELVIVHFANDTPIAANGDCALKITDMISFGIIKLPVVIPTGKLSGA